MVSGASATLGVTRPAESCPSQSHGGRREETNLTTTATPSPTSPACSSSAATAGDESTHHRRHRETRAVEVQRGRIEERIGFRGLRDFGVTRPAESCQSQSHGGRREGNQLGDDRHAITNVTRVLLFCANSPKAPISRTDEGVGSRCLRPQRLRPAFHWGNLNRGTSEARYHGRVERLQEE